MVLQADRDIDSSSFSSEIPFYEAAATKALTGVKKHTSRVHPLSSNYDFKSEEATSKRLPKFVGNKGTQRSLEEDSSTKPRTKKRKLEEVMKATLKQTEIQNEVLMMTTDEALHSKQVLQKLMRHECGWIFNQPVDPVALAIPDYFDVISHPMDFGTILQKLKKNFYKSTGQFVNDVNLVFSNCFTYNPPGSQAYVMGQTLEKLFQEHFEELSKRRKKDKKEKKEKKNRKEKKKKENVPSDSDSPNAIADHQSPVVTEENPTSPVALQKTQPEEPTEQ